MPSENPTYPVLTASTWWKLRKKFNSSIPKEITKSYLASALDMSESSAKSNVIPKLKLIGFIDEDNKPTDLSIRWRDDSEYSKVCDELIQKLYPSELPDAIDHPLDNREKIVKWFQSKARVGEGAAQMMTGFYLLLVDADSTKQGSVTQPKGDKAKKSVIPQKSQSVSSDTIKNTKEDNSTTNGQDSLKVFKPTIHLDIQIHISPDSSADQIDKIFESMSKHLGGFKML